MTIMTEDREGTTRSFPVDVEHGGMRLMVSIVFIAGVPISYILINLLIPGQGINLIALIGALGLAYVYAQFTENYLKKNWSSGRLVRVDADSAQIIKKGKVESTIDVQQQVNVLMWHFKVPRRARVPKGWYMIACMLEQEDESLPVYTFVSPTDFESMEAGNHFKKLVRKKELKSQDMERNLRMAGEQRRLHNAETRRWMEGAEMSKEDFESYVAHLQAQFPTWMPSN